MIKTTRSKEARKFVGRLARRLADKVLERLKGEPLSIVDLPIIAETVGSYMELRRYGMRQIMLILWGTSFGIYDLWGCSRSENLPRGAWDNYFFGHTHPYVSTRFYVLRLAHAALCAEVWAQVVWRGRYKAEEGKKGRISEDQRIAEVLLYHTRARAA